jgi:hypothetical protein
MIGKAAPIKRTLTVCEGRDTLGFIHELWNRQFSAEPLNGESLGLFPTTAAAAEAISADHKKQAANSEGGTF